MPQPKVSKQQSTQTAVLRPLQARLTAAKLLYGKIQAAPQAWLTAQARATNGKGGTSTTQAGGNGINLQLLECNSYKDLVNSWRKAMKWIEGLDCALSVMLSSIISVPSVGEQLWCKIISPPSCLHGDTPIYDPIDKSTKSVSTRWKDNKEFHVLSLKDSEMIITKAKVPHIYQSSPIFKVTLQSGRQISVTLGHKFLAGESGYKSLEEMIGWMKNGGSAHLSIIDKIKLGGITSWGYVGSERIIEVESCGEDCYFDFHVPETNNYWCNGMIHHNTGKTVLCEALSVNLQYVVAKSTIRGFFSGWKSADGSDTSLFPKIVGRTLVIKDGDTLIRAPNLEQILAEARDIYDGKARTHYRNEREDEYTGRCTIILSGTNSLRRIDSSELGERFLDCVIVEEIDDDLEEEIAWRVANRAVRNISQEATEEISTNYDPPMANAMQLTGGYISYLRENANELLSQITIEEAYLRKVVQLGKFVAYLRARPSRIHDEKAQREFCGRLVIQITRLTMCLTAVLNKTKVDNEVMRRVIKVAMDTARGNTLEVVQHLGNADHGMELKALTLLTSAKSDQSVRSLLIFLKQIGVTEVNLARSRNGVKVNGQRWQLTAKMRKLLHNIENTEE